MTHGDIIELWTVKKLQSLACIFNQIISTLFIMYMYLYCDFIIQLIEEIVFLKKMYS